MELLDALNPVNHKPILDLLWQLITTKLFAGLNTRAHPELARLITDDAKYGAACAIAESSIPDH